MFYSLHANKALIKSLVAFYYIPRMPNYPEKLFPPVGSGRRCSSLLLWRKELYDLLECMSTSSPWLKKKRERETEEEFTLLELDSVCGLVAVYAVFITLS